MKEYIKPNIISENILERTALACQDTNYYVRATWPCYDTFIGTGKADLNCYKLSS